MSSPASRAAQRAFKANPAVAARKSEAMDNAESAVASIRAMFLFWPTIETLARELVRFRNWSDFKSNRARLNRWIANGTFRGSKVRAVKDGATYRLELREQ